ncbi:MAG TPA: DUF805 domain-containing protein [bacterium]|nr:DUF805 domain-containing protein [bacterium]
MDKLISIYFKWTGRINRTTYWLYSIPLVLALFANNYFIYETNDTLYLIILAAIFYPAMMINIKRSHDRNRTGFFTLLLLVPILSLWPLIEFGFIRGSKGFNEHGSDPQ